MNDITEERRLFREAADLAIRLQNDPANPVALDMVRGWVGRGPAYQHAWARVAAIYGMTGQLLTDESGGGEQRVLSRRHFIAGGALAVGAVAIGAATLPDLLLRLRADEVTATAELREIDLPDGSRLTLGPDSALELGVVEGGHRLELLAGMAYLDTLHHQGRQLQVRCGRLNFSTDDAACELSIEAGTASLSVGRGSVEAWSEAARQPLPVQAGDWLRLDGAGPLQRGTRDPAQVGTWRNGMLVAENESVAVVVARLQRWQGGEVFVADPGLGARLVSGVFDLSDPLRALDAVVRPFGGKVRSLGGMLTVISSV